MGNAMKEPVIIGDATLYLGDCRDILPTLPRVGLIFSSNQWPPPKSERLH